MWNPFWDVASLAKSFPPSLLSRISVLHISKAIFSGTALQGQVGISCVLLFGFSFLLDCSNVSTHWKQRFQDGINRLVCLVTPFQPFKFSICMHLLDIYTYINTVCQISKQLSEHDYAGEVWLEPIEAHHIYGLETDFARNNAATATQLIHFWLRMNMDNS